MTNSQTDELYALATKYRMTAEEVESIGTWAGKITLLAIEPLKAENERLKTLLENYYRAVKTYTNLYHEAQAKLAMMAEALKSADPCIESLYQSSINTRNQGLGEQHSCNPEAGCDGLCMDAYQAGLVTGMIHRALAATTEDVERWKAEQRKAWEAEAVRALEEEYFSESTAGGVSFAVVMIALKASAMNATRYTQELERLSYAGKELGDWRLTIESIPKQEKPNA